MSAHRRPPPYPYQGPLRRGQCKFCGEMILPASTKRGRALGYHERRHPERCQWHLECLEVYQIATSSEAARRAVLKRDKGICQLCGTDTLRLVSRPGIIYEPWWLEHDDEIPPSRLRRAQWLREDKPEIAGPYCSVRFVERYVFEVDHIVPLYRAPREWRYFGLENLRLLCVPCHRSVTAEQARERAGGDRRQLELAVEGA